jgi:creatinine amidohydrolase
MSDQTAAAFPGLLEEMTLEEVKTFQPEVVVVPLGSTEPHGPHLPLGTDNFEVTRLCRIGVAEANASGARALLYPTLPITNNANFRSFPFALRIGVRTLVQVLLDIAAQCYADGIRKLVLVNGHGGNPAALDTALREMASRDDMPFACWTWGEPPADFESPIEHPSDHAGESETSKMLWIRPDLVRTDRLDHFPIGKLRVPALAQAQFVRPWHGYMPASAGGETRAATAEKGEALTKAQAAGLTRLLVELSAAPYDEHFPYAENKPSEE